MKLPPEATLVFPGILFDIYQWDQEMYDGSTSRFEMLKRKPSADVIVIDGDKILIAEEEQPTKWVFPSIIGGGLDAGEAPQECAARELREEIGYEAGEWQLFREYFGASSKLHYHESLFIARNAQKVCEPHLDGWEKISFRWVSFDEFLQFARHPKFSISLEFKMEMYEALLDPVKYDSLRKEIFWK